MSRPPSALRGTSLRRFHSVLTDNPFEPAAGEVRASKNMCLCVCAEKVLLEAVLADISSLDGALRQVKSTSRGYHAEFVGITGINANKVCARLKAETSECEAVLAVAIND